MNKLLLNSIKNIQKKTPLWFLRQSGRHVPEYFEIRAKAKNFIEFCLNKNLVVESTKLPLKYHLDPLNNLILVILKTQSHQIRLLELPLHK